MHENLGAETGKFKDATRLSAEASSRWIEVANGAGIPTGVNNYTYPCTVVRVIDGDTVVVDADLGLRVWMIIPVRVYGMNAPEHGTVDGDAATVAARALLPAGAAVVLRTYKPTSGDGLEKFGRWLAVITLPDGQSFADVMIAAGHAVFYDGGTR